MNAKKENVIWKVSGECMQSLLKITLGAEELAPEGADMIFNRAAIKLFFFPRSNFLPCCPCQLRASESSVI